MQRITSLFDLTQICKLKKNISNIFFTVIIVIMEQKRKIRFSLHMVSKYLTLTATH